MRDETVRIKIDFFTNLSKNIIQRNISEEKLKRVANIKIELEKFKGYESKMNIYTFHNEFQKLVEPALQKNYLSGAALTLVETIEDINNIWKKLFESFCDTRLLLQNKLGHLDKTSILWKIKGNEKIALAIAVLINSMMELSLLAKKHSLEGELYMGGGLEKVLGVLGESRKRKFLSENTGKTLGKQGLRDRLMEFLSKEQATRETCALYEKIDKCWGIESTSNRDSNIKSGGQRFGNSVNANTMASGGKTQVLYLREG